MQKIWYFEYKSQHICVKYTKGQYWFFLGEEKLKTIWCLYQPYAQHDIIEYFKEISML